MSFSVRRFRQFLFTLSASVGLVSMARAHQFWIEPLDGALVARFGNIGKGVEQSPGRLDRFIPPVAWAPYAGTDIEPDILVVSKKNDHFLIEEAALKRPVVLQTSSPVVNREADGERPAVSRLSWTFARWHAAGAKAAPSAPLDLVPGEDGEVKVFFKGQPLPETKLTLFTPAGETESLTADADGSVKIDAKAPGLYVLRTSHSDEEGGTYLGSSYTSTGYSICLSWKQGD